MRSWACRVQAASLKHLAPVRLHADNHAGSLFEPSFLAFARRFTSRALFKKNPSEYADQRCGNYVPNARFGEESIRL